MIVSENVWGGIASGVCIITTIAFLRGFELLAVGPIGLLFLAGFSGGMTFIFLAWKIDRIHEAVEGWRVS